MDYQNALLVAMPQVYSVSDGYTGQRVDVRLALLDGAVVEVSASGCYRAPVSTASSNDEVLWLVANHPTMRQRYKLLSR